MEYFCCYHSYSRKLAKLSDQEVGRLFRALLKYSETGETQELTGRESVAFDFIADDIDRAKENYEAKCKQNRENRMSTSVNGRQRPSTSTYKNKNKDKNENKDKGEEKGGDTRARGENSAVSAVFTAYFDKIDNTMTDGIRDSLMMFIGTMGSECCIRAIDAAVEANKKSWNYVRRVLEAKRDQGVRSIADWDKKEAERNARKPDREDAAGSSGADERWHLKSHTL